MFKKILFGLATVLLWASLAFGQTLYYQDSGTATIGWDAPVGITVDHYNILVIRDSGEQTAYNSATTQVQVSKGRSGIFTVQIQAVEAGTGKVSSWCVSNSGCGKLKDGTVGPWKMIFRPTAPTP